MIIFWRLDFCVSIYVLPILITQHLVYTLKKYISSVCKSKFTVLIETILKACNSLVIYNVQCVPKATHKNHY